MLTKKDQELIRSLAQTKHRTRSGLFVAEGLRLVSDMLGGFSCSLLVVSEESYHELSLVLDLLSPQHQPRRIEVMPEGYDFGRISQQATAQPALALFGLPRPELPSSEQLPDLCLMLDRVQDPGNMGTIIRTADWFGISHILLTDGCADPYAPKVVQSTMGALSRTSIHQLGEDGASFLATYRGEVLGTYLTGDNLYTSTLPSDKYGYSALLLMGNEGKGISPMLAPFVTKRITIPSFATGTLGSESLNVAIATALCLGELRRREVR